MFSVPVLRLDLGLRRIYLCFSFTVFLLLVLSPHWDSNHNRHNWVDAQNVYTSHNLCISHRLDYLMELHRDDFSIMETITMRPVYKVFECFFYAEKFDVNFITARHKGNQDIDPILQQLPNYVYSIRLKNHGMWKDDSDYEITFSGRKSFTKAGEGLIFKAYRERATFKKNWYALVYMSPSQCGKAFFCTNNLRDLLVMKIQAIHWKTHKLHCAGVTTVKEYDSDRFISTCENTFKVGVNNLHYSLSNFLTLEHVTRLPRTNETLHHITLVAPMNDQQKMYPEIERQFNVILKMYSILLLTIHLRRFHAVFYVLPNYYNDIPEIFSGSCYFKMENLLYNIELETTYRSFLRCLLHQGYMNERVTDSWQLKYVPEGLFEKLLNTYAVKNIKNDYYADCLLGDEDDLDILAKYELHPGNIHLKRPWRKAAGFWNMLEAISPEYGRMTYSVFASNDVPIETHGTFVQWVTEHSNHLHLNQTQFLEMLYTWTAARGYPIVRAKVLVNRTVCIYYHNVGFYLGSVIFPFILEYNYPNWKETRMAWVDPKLDNNCHTVRSNLYPYLINSRYNVIGRVLYEQQNWDMWSRDLLKRKVRESLTSRQKVNLIMDAVYFAQRQELDWPMTIRFLVIIGFETDELSWRSYEQILEYLDGLTRYTTMNVMLKRLISDIVENYYYAQKEPTGIALKWYCMAGQVVCLKATEKMVHEALRNYQFTPDRREVMCAGMRRLSMDTFNRLIYNLGKPEWREPIFYIDMLVCTENKNVLRNLMHYLFFRKSWKFRTKLLAGLMKKMIKMSKAGSDAFLWYLDHDPVAILTELEIENVLDLFDVLAKYMRNNDWLHKFIKRLRLRNIWDEKHLLRVQAMLGQMKENKRWYNKHYDYFSMYIIKGYYLELARFEF